MWLVESGMREESFNQRAHFCPRMSQPNRSPKDEKRLRKKLKQQLYVWKICVKYLSTRHLCDFHWNLFVFIDKTLSKWTSLPKNVPAQLLGCRDSLAALFLFQKGQFWPKMSYPDDVYDENIWKGQCNLLSKKRFIKPIEWKDGSFQRLRDHLRRITLEFSNDLFGESSYIFFEKKKWKQLYLFR